MAFASIDPTIPRTNVFCRQSCHLLTPSHPGFPQVTILLASSVRTLVHCVVKYSRPPDLQSASNVSLPFAWITGLARDPSNCYFVSSILKHEQKNCTLLLWYHKLNCFCSFFGRIEDTKKTF